MNEHSKICTKCGVEKSSTEFYLHGGSRCKECLRVQARMNKRKTYDREKNRVAKNKYRRAYPEKEKVRRKKQHLMHQKRDRNYHLKRKYGIGINEYDALFKTQNGLCSICNNPPGSKILYVDHNHSTKQVRRLICRDCNLGLGNFKDNPNLLRAGADYLETYDEELKFESVMNEFKKTIQDILQSR